MKVSKGEGNISINLTAEEDMLEKVNGKRGAAEEQKKSIYAGDTNMMQQSDKVAEKKIEAQRKALKIIMDTYAGEKSIDDSQDAMREENKELETGAKEAGTEIEKLDNLRKQAQEASKVTEDSEEQKNLELLQKQRAILKGDSQEQLTEEEQGRLTDMGALTDYQKEMLQYDSMQEVWEERQSDSVQQKTVNNKTISAVEVERLKSSPMVSAGKEAEEIMKASSKEIIGMLKDEAVDHIDEKLEEQKEKAEKIKEKKDEEEEIKKKDETDSQKAAEDMKTASNADKVQDKLEAELRRIQNEVIGEDIKGLAVDKQI